MACILHPLGVTLFIGRWQTPPYARFVAVPEDLQPRSIENCSIEYTSPRLMGTEDSLHCGAEDEIVLPVLLITGAP